MNHSAPSSAPHSIERRAILHLVWPVILSNLLTTTVQWVDLFMVARMGKETVAAVGLAAFITTLAWTVLMAIQIGTQILVAQAWGAGNREQIDHAVQIALALGVAAATAGALLLGTPRSPILHAVFAAFDVEPAVLDIGVTYLGITFLALPGLAISLVAQAAMRAVSDTRTPLVLTGAANVLHIGFNYVLIFGKLGFPALGVAGAAWGTVGARALEALAYLVLLYSGRYRLRLRISHLALDWPVIRTLLRLGAPTAGEHAVLSGGFLLYQRVITSYGTEALAAYQIGVILLQAAMMPGFAFSIAATTLVGQWVGAEDRDRAQLAMERCRDSALLMMSSLGLVFFALAETFSRWVLADPSVVDKSTQFIRLLALSQPFMAAHFVLTGALRGAGDVRSALSSAVLAMFGVRLPLSWLASFVFHWPLVVPFVAMLLEHAARAALMQWRWGSGRWRTIARVG